ncbi:Predicted arabinose efflux permease, MFS family [Fontimonas thermophila]|uniref:Predicted arabinose efflux permease, MFS family n=1 Tax=Fontimonas thermophila TaxID=1076937 RepID=A0A1I2HBH7_9GAMM|nr:MFS transporter [Fontimonas thermophila]SFF26317.1 Predicted arabinose efflux permease, MFS family [Fontimonas thermophila]
MQSSTPQDHGSLAADGAANAHDPYAALRFREFRYLIGASFLLNAALSIQQVAVGYALYRITGDPLSLGLIGLAEAIPFIALALFGGHLADRRDKRALMRASLCVVFLATSLLALISQPEIRAALSQTAWLWAVYLSIGVLGLARGVLSPAAAALRAFLVPRTAYPSAATWSSTLFQAASILGPVAGGLAYAGLGLTGALLLTLALTVFAERLVARIAPRPAPADPQMRAPIWQSLREGLAYVRRTKIIFYAITLDMFSVLFGGVVAILPVFAEDILRIGPEGLGVLRSAPALGAMLTVLACTWLSPIRHAWRNLLLAVAGFGMATLVFAVSERLWLSAAALFLTGVFDSISVVIRQTILQMIPPDHLRGRVQAVNSIFISSSNELGAFESGLAARLMGAVPSVLFGGAMTLAVVAVVWQRSRALLAVRLAPRS